MVMLRVMDSLLGSLLKRVNDAGQDSIRASLTARLTKHVLAQVGGGIF
jgi:hypothetical protein